MKFSDSPYPNSPSSTFRNHFQDLTKAIECFRTSQQSKEILSAIRNYKISEDIGLLFWLTNDDSSYDDLIAKLTNVRFSEDLSYDSFYIVDNKRVDFIYKSLKYSKSRFTDSDITFFYPDTGKNIVPTIKKNFGKILPIEYINTSILPLRIEDVLTKKTTLALFTIEPFETEDLKRLISLSKELSKSWPSKIVILFPDYNEVRNSSDVRIAKSAFEEETFTEHISVDSYNDNFKSLQL